jgi:predicted phage tail protein
VHRREGFIERVLHRIERYIEEADERIRAREEEFEHYRETLWAEAAERERLLVRAVGEEEVRERSLEEVAKEHRVAFVVHSEGAGRALKELADGGARLVSVVPGSGSFETSAGVKGSWLVFE